MATHPANEPDAMEDVARQKACSGLVTKLKVPKFACNSCQVQRRVQKANNKRWSNGTKNRIRRVQQRGGNVQEKYILARLLISSTVHIA